jgi:hypothetical protein
MVAISFYLVERAAADPETERRDELKQQRGGMTFRLRLDRVNDFASEPVERLPA